MKTPKFRFILLVILLILGAVWGWNRWKLVSGDAWQTMGNADRVEIFRLDGSNFAARSSAGFDGIYPITSRVEWREDVKIERARRAIRAALAEVEWAKWSLSHGSKECEPTPGIGMRFWRGSQSVDIPICFECMMWHWPDEANWHDFDASGLDLLNVSLAAFPQDKKLLRLRNQWRDSPE